MNDSDKKYLLISIIGHVLIFMFLTIKIYFFPMERPEFVRSVRVDLVALPDKDPEEGPPGVEKPPAAEATAKAPSPPPAKQETPPAPTEKPSKVSKAEKKPESKKEESKTSAPDTKSQQSDALKRLQALSNLKKRLKDSKKDGPEGKEYKGNQVSEGNSLTGVEKLQHDKYLSQLDMHIKRNWQLPEWLSQKNLSATVFVRFDEAGLLLEKRLMRSSGDAAFDREAVQAIVASAPLPAPPENLVSYFKVRGIELRFPE